MSPIKQRVVNHIEDAPYKEEADPMLEMEQNLEVITQGIPEYVTIDDVPL